MRTRILSILLLASISFSLAACGTDSGENENTANDSQSTNTTLPIENGPTLELPEELDYTGETVRVLGSGNIVVGSNEEDATFVKQSVYQQFLAVSELLGVEFEHINLGHFTEVDDAVMQSVNSDSDDFDLVFDVCQQQLKLVYSGYMLPLSELQYIDLEKPWWNRDYIESISINSENPYILFGSITYNNVERTTCVFFNKRLMKELHGLTDQDIYDTVLDGKWTLDMLEQLSASVYQDDGNTQNDADDLHGIVTDGIRFTFEQLAYSAGLRFTSRDEDGYPVINLNTEDTVDLVDKLLSICINDSFFIADNDSSKFVGKFANGKSLFISERFYLASWEAMREMTDDFGIIPMPKYDESIDGYHSVTGNYVTWGAVPVTVSNPDMVSAVTEALAYYGYQHVIPAYYETTLKLKYTRGDDIDTQSRILDIIADGARTDFLYLNRLGGLGDLFHTVATTGQNSFSSLYATYEPGAEVTLSKLIAEDESQN